MNLDAKDEFWTLIKENLEQEGFIKLTLSKATKAIPSLKNIYFRVVKLQSQTLLSATWRYQTNDQVKNYEFNEGLELIKSLLPNHFLNAHLMTLKNDFVLKYNKKRKPALFKQPPSHHEIPDQKHDKQKYRLIDPKKSQYLQALGIISSNGLILKERQKKFRQINKFIEVIHHLIEKLPFSSGKLNVVDMGSGKGYLTFALYDYLKHQTNFDPKVTGIELRPTLVDYCNDIAQQAEFEDLHFQAKPIEHFVAQDLHVLIALHACDIATDIAIAKGIIAGAELIVVAPCCHKQIRKVTHPDKSLAPMLKNGILLERQCEIVTDSIRALVLEMNGYETKVFEFISTEHTRKNVMITAIKGRKNEKAQDQIEAIKRQFGIPYHYLETLLEPRKQ